MLRVVLIQTYRAAVKIFAMQSSPNVMLTVQTALASTNAWVKLLVVDQLVPVTMAVRRDVPAVQILFAVARIFI